MTYGEHDGSRRVAGGGVLPLVTALLILLSAGCQKYLQREVITGPGAGRLDTSVPVLKVHFRDGRFCRLTSWTVNERDRWVEGEAEYFDAGRALLLARRDTISLDSIALFETTKLVPSPAVAGMAVLTALSGALSFYCATNPKACFGSCPTFYSWDGDAMSLEAEGFSSSILPSLEATDIDPLVRARPEGGRLLLRLTNEALETHVLRSADLLAVPRLQGAGRILMTPGGDFLAAGPVVPPARAAGPEGECTDLVSDMDGRERFSLTDSADLALREEIDLRFDSVLPGRVGLVVGFRQSLVTTYLFYQTLAYLGKDAAGFLAEAERDRGGFSGRLAGLGHILGGIEVLAQREPGEKWEVAGEFSETGPIARNLQVIPLPAGLSDPSHIRLRMAKGAWRIDAAGLVSLEEPAGGPIRLRPREVLRGEEPDSLALGALLDPARTLVTYPGDEFTIVYELPRGGEGMELFLESRGYYLEWMRQAWLAEEDPAKAVGALADPAGYLRREARGFKSVESTMEASFWGSRYAK